MLNENSIAIGDDSITIEENSFYKIHVMDYEEFDFSMFKDCFSKAEDNLHEIMQSVENMSNGNNNKKNKFSKTAHMNNIITFIGERGTGKTSTMLSFAGALEDKKYLEDKLNTKAEFKVLDVIDPTMIEKNESLLQIIIARLFSDFKIKANDKCEYSHLKNRRILESFDKVFGSLKLLYSNEFIKKVDSYDSLEALNSLAIGSNIRVDIEKLINNILEDELKECKSRFLVIPIDDLDLTISEAEIMVEEIRKYLMIPNVIVLMSANMNQLIESIELMYLKEYKELINSKKELFEPTRVMALRYIEKVMPLNRRIYMPKL